MTCRCSSEWRTATVNASDARTHQSTWETLRGQVPSLPLYPEGRPTTRPTSSLILKLYADITRHAITHDGNVLHAYPVTLTDTQQQVLNLLDIPTERYTHA